MSGQEGDTEEEPIWGVNAAGEARDVNGRLATAEERRDLRRELAKKASEHRASTVELRCLHALRQRAAREQEEHDDTTD